MAQDLVDAFLAGEPAAVFRLTRWVSLEIRSLGGVRTDGDREDLLQETLLRLCDVLGRGGFRGESGLERFVRSVARHIFIDYLRARPRRAVTADPDPTTEKESREDPAGDLAARDEAERVLAALPEEERRLLVEAYVLERSYSEMAASRRIQTGALKVRVFRAVRRARAAMAKLKGR